MSSSANKFMDREPRYVLTESDSRFLCFISHRNRKRSYAVNFTNISTTGLAFVIEDVLAPDLGEFIKLEFTVPGYEQIACIGRVVRLEHYLTPALNRPNAPSLVLVALVFENLSKAHQKALQFGLEKKIRTQQIAQLRNHWGSFIAWMITYSKMIFMITSFVILLILIIYWLLQPTENYLEIIPVPWGTRFK